MFNCYRLVTEERRENRFGLEVINSRYERHIIGDVVEINGRLRLPSINSKRVAEWRVNGIKALEYITTWQIENCVHRGCSVYVLPADETTRRMYRWYTMMQHAANCGYKRPQVVRSYAGFAYDHEGNDYYEYVEEYENVNSAQAERMHKALVDAARYIRTGGTL